MSSSIIAPMCDRSVEPVLGPVYLLSMREVPSSEARMHWSRLLACARRGESFTITYRGRPVARLVPASTATDASDVAASIRRLRDRATRLGASGLGADEIRALIDEGQR